jgi:ketosteroid isomerase-like protein
MSQENVEIVKRAVAALNERDLDRYMACCTKGVQLVPPITAIEGTYEGAAGVRRFFADIEDAMPDFRLEVERVEAIGPDRVLAFLHATGRGRASGIDRMPGGTGDFAVTNIYDLADGKIRRVRVYGNRDEALEAAGLSE